MPDVGDFVVELACLGVDGVVCCVLYQGYKFVNKGIADVKSAPVLPFSGLRNDHTLADMIENHPGVVREPDTGDLRLPYAVIRGHVGPMRKKTELSSHYSSFKDVKGVIQTFALTEHKKHFSRSGFWHTSKRGIHTFANEVPFGLTPSSYPYSSSFQRPPIEVVDWRDANRLELDTTHDQFRESPTSIGAHLLGWLTGDIQKGVQSTERMLLNGTAVTAVGELTFCRDDRQVRVQAPADGRGYFLTKSNLSTLVKELESESKVLKWVLVAFGGIGGIIVGIAAYRFYRKWKSESAARANVDVLRQGPNSPNIDTFQIKI